MQSLRRTFIKLAASLSSAPFAAWSQPSGVRRIGVLVPSTRTKEEATLQPFFKEMRRLGWIEGQNIVYDWKTADDDQHLLQSLASELVARRPELIYAPPSTAALAARKATQTIPVVFATSTDPVGSGLVQSLGHPGGNVTGVSSVAESLAPRLVQLLREIIPSATLIGFVGDPFDPRWKIDGEALAQLDKTLGITIRRVQASDPRQLDAAVNDLIGQRVHAIVTGSTITYNLRHRLVEIASRSRVPVAGHRAELSDAGALFSYSGPLHEQLRRSAQLVDKVLRGQRPADIPVEQPTKFELVVNLKAAKALGVAVPRSVVLAADRLIQ